MGRGCSRTRRDRGVALVLVMTVVLALSLIATPFVISMLLQERLGTTARYGSQAGYAADGARNYALWRLMYSVDHQERRFASGQFASYHYDDAREFDVRLDDAYLATQAQALNPRGSIWGLSVQDEQGKINVRTAGANAVNQINALLANTVGNRKDYLTLYSGRDASWVFPQRIRTIGGVGNPLQPGGNTGINVDNAVAFGPGSRVRVSKYGLPTVTGRINDTQGGLNLDTPVGSQYVDGMIEVELRHPVNLNTARFETLVAVFSDLDRPGVQNGRARVDRAAAGAIARGILQAQQANQRLTRIEEFALFVAGLGNLNNDQRVTVLLNSVCPSAFALQGTGTVGLCFRSYDVHTIEAFGSMNNPAGAQVAGRGFREVVSVSPPSVLTRFVESQLDFDLMFAAGTSIQGASIAGYPYGNRMVSFPQHLPHPANVPPTGPSNPPNLVADLVLKPQQQPGPNGNEAFVRPRPADDWRGEGDFDQELFQESQQNYPQLWWQNDKPRHTFPDTQEGKKLRNAALTFPWNCVLPKFKDNPGPAGILLQPDLGIGGFEMWFRPDTAIVPQPIFDIREADWYNRLTLRAENGELILTACDGTLGNPGTNGGDGIDNGAAEIRMPYPLNNDTWHHVMAGWKSTLRGDLALLADGFSHPAQKFRYVNPEGTELLTEISAQMNNTATSWALKNDGWFPPNVTIGILNHPVALRIGTECVLYDKSAGALIRGARGTTAVQHPANARVMPWGYSRRLGTQPINVRFSPQYSEALQYDRIMTGGGKLTGQGGLGVNPQAVVAGDKQDPNNPAIRFIDNSQTTIGVTTSNIMDFPNEGYIRIDGEVIFYGSRATGAFGGQGNAQFQNCVRGGGPGINTTPAQHNTGRPVELWGFPVTSTAQYPQKTVIQIDDEWFCVQKNLDTTRPNFWISFLDTSSGTPVPVSLVRGLACLGSIPNTHAGGADVIPTFSLQGRSAGPGDTVTVTDVANYKERQTVRRTSESGQQQGGPNFQLGGQQIVGFAANVGRETVGDGFYARLLKFPSGELIGLPWLQSSNPSVTIGPFDGVVDEVKFFASRHAGVGVGREMTTGDVDMMLNRDPTQMTPNWGNMPLRGGLWKIGDEYVGWGSLTAQNVTQLRRGWLNSLPEIHEVGDPIFDLTWVPVSTLSRDITATDRVIPLQQKLSGPAEDRQRRWDYRRGYVLVDNELIGFEYNNGDGLQLSMPVKFDGMTGLYRGAFGTAAMTHAANQSLVYGVPFRYWDTYRKGEFDSTMVYWQWSTKMDLANWRTFKWTQEVPASDPNIVVHALVRVDGKGEFWDAPAVNAKISLWDFVTAGTSNAINQIGFQRDAGQFDARFYVEYLRGSYDATQPWVALSWKRAPRIRELQVEYDRPTQTLYHEDK